MKSDEQIIIKIIAYSDKITRFCDGADKETFLSDEMLHEACVFNMIQMGELINKLSDEFLHKNASIPWHEIRGLRNRLVHAYGEINLNLIWDIINTGLHDIKCKLKSIAETEKQPKRKE